MKKRIIKLTESDLSRIVKKTMREMDRELEEGFDDEFSKNYRGGKDFSEEEFEKLPEINYRNLKDDSTTPTRFYQNKLDNFFKDKMDELGYEDEEGEEY